MQDGSYPGTGKIDEVGHGSGEGATLNLPLPGGSGDFAMRTVFDEVIVPSAQRFKPDIILVSAGWVAYSISSEYTISIYFNAFPFLPWSTLTREVKLFQKIVLVRSLKQSHDALFHFYLTEPEMRLSWFHSSI